MRKPIPIIDLFAGPGGLGEGFSRYPMGQGEKAYKIKLSIEKDPYAHKTLTTRAFYRQFPEGETPDEYYAYLRGEMSREELFAAYPQQAQEAMHEAQCRTLGADPEISQLIGDALDGAKDWVLIGGPPCQAYSLVGRSRMLGATLQEGESVEEYTARKKQIQEEFESDHRHTLYLEYLKIIADHKPAVFVMENVKGILSAKLKGEKIFPKILEDLSAPNQALGRDNDTELKYRIRSFVKSDEDSSSVGLEANDYLIRSEEYGIPQARHRVILLGVREDYADRVVDVLEPCSQKTVKEVIGDLPGLTPGLSKEKGVKVHAALRSITEESWWPQFKGDPHFKKVAKRMEAKLKVASKEEQRGESKLSGDYSNADPWYGDENLVGVCNHETRSHIREDLWRYFFCACYAEEYDGKAPGLRDFPTQLLPNHKNVDEAVKGQKFGDRFRVQSKNRYATTVTSHISKDGHYFIHYDPKQYRSLTVREAARIQTFPDNYFFEGPRTQQYHQVGNAVPPMLATKLAEIVHELLRSGCI